MDPEGTAKFTAVFSPLTIRPGILILSLESKAPFPLKSIQAPTKAGRAIETPWTLNWNDPLNPETIALKINPSS